MTKKFQFEDVRHDATLGEADHLLYQGDYHDAVVALVKVTEAAQRLSERASWVQWDTARGDLDTEIAALTKALSAFEFPEGRS